MCSNTCRKTCRKTTTQNNIENKHRNNSNSPDISPPFWHHQKGHCSSESCPPKSGSVCEVDGRGGTEEGVLAGNGGPVEEVAEHDQKEEEPASYSSDKCRRDMHPSSARSHRCSWDRRILSAAGAPTGQRPQLYMWLHAFHVNLYRRYLQQIWLVGSSSFWSCQATSYYRPSIHHHDFFCSTSADYFTDGLWWTWFWWSATPFDDVKKGERYLGSYLVISVLFWVVVFLHVFGHFLFVDMCYGFEVGMNLPLCMDTFFYDMAVIFVISMCYMWLVVSCVYTIIWPNHIFLEDGGIYGWMEVTMYAYTLSLIHIWRCRRRG